MARFGSNKSKNAGPQGSEGGEDTLLALKDVVGRIAVPDQRSATKVPFLSILHSSQTSPLGRGILRPSFCLIVQGRKKIQLGTEILLYGEGQYVASGIDMPIGGHIVSASKAVPYLAVVIDLEPREIASVALEAALTGPSKRTSEPCAFVGTSDEDLKGTLLRLLRLLEDSGANHFLAENCKRELIYRLLTSENGHVLYQNTVGGQSSAGVGKAISWLKDNFNHGFKIEQLAKTANMSVSSLQHQFKAVTTMSPLQYQKRLRLQEARTLLLAGDMDAASVAYQVGYESHTQFNREYRRLFGAPPKADIKNLRLDLTGSTR